MSVEELVIRVDPVYTPYSKPERLLGSYKLTEFQVEVSRELGKRSDVLLVAPTGSGKTLTLLLSPGLDGEDFPGFVALYPNNVLLQNQMETVASALSEALGARPLEGFGGDSSLLVYEVPAEVGCDLDAAVCGSRYVALQALSGRFIVGDPTKRDFVYKQAEMLYKLSRKGGLYHVVFATPDTYLLIYTGAYRDFEDVGKTVHNLLVSLAAGKDERALEDALRSTKTATRFELSKIQGVKERVLVHPVFVDEFHLYGPYEVDALHAVISMFKSDTNLPVVFSSATPADDILEELQDAGVRPSRVEARVSKGEGFGVKGPMELVLHPVETEKKGIGAYYEASEAVQEIVLENLRRDLEGFGGGKALVILERLYAVAELAVRLKGEGIPCRCIASDIVTRNLVGACVEEAQVIVGSEATSQGVNLGPVKLGYMGGVAAEDVVQRLGRVGRRGVPSRVRLAVPAKVLEKHSPPDSTDYAGLVKWVGEAFTNYARRKRDVVHFLSEKIRRFRRNIIRAVGAVSLARVSGNTSALRNLGISGSEAAEMLETFVGPPEQLSRLVMFRKSGFSVRYTVEGGSGEGEDSIGLITRNFEIVGSERGVLKIRLKRARGSLVIESSGNLRGLSQKIVDLADFLRLTRGRLIVEMGDGEVELARWKEGGVLRRGDAMVYVLEQGPEISEYIAYTGEGASVRNPQTGRSYAVIFI
ncbi:DEAD/DEAH box helicase [Thermofilum pendens]|uniref:DEAD/DEAH box helicase domain protein n=1 Tax=Thermofilum pendens (strain DSM 2475 / Hrk 5) TaxID=368408 RepID=A1RZU0_THEPD|nr:DEAD/DEAH box helicase [Thermofilum pendens]ABL78720.1 DEAD/DEAH box helicase domain protein [Thermofilum pendens Hrk 5]